MTITLTVSGRIATVDATAHVVAGNTYPVALSLDSEWTGSLYLRVRFGSLYYDIPFASSATSVDVQMPVGYPEVGIGVFSEALEICSCEARIRLLRSILEAGEQVVEFDSDLYDQWAGEVSELLCDSDFDAESERPVKNSVLTAWKNTVPIDSALVHKTGNETINGNKTFTARMFVREPSIPSIHVVSETAYTTTGWKGLVGFFDQKDGANNEAAGIYTSVASGEINLGLRVHKPNRSGQFDTLLRSYNDHQVIIVTPYYPTDSGGNPIPLGAPALISSGNIAVDPRLVHTTGNETIAGNKSLRGNLAVESSYPLVEMHCTSDVGTTGTKGAINFLEGGSSVGKSSLFAYQASNLRQMMLRHFRDGSGFADMGVVLTDTNLAWGEAPTYTADNNADAKIVTRSMLASSPTVVHTTGNETIAGVKDFTGACKFDRPRFSQLTLIMHSHEWGKMYEINPPSYGSGYVVRVFDSYNVYNFRGVEVRFKSSPATASGYVYNTTNLRFRMAQRTTDGKWELWVYNASTVNIGVVLDVEYYAGNKPAILGAIGNEPVVGDDYTAVVDLTNQ